MSGAWYSGDPPEAVSSYIAACAVAHNSRISLGVIEYIATGETPHLVNCTIGRTKVCSCARDEAAAWAQAESAARMLGGG